MIPSDKKCSYSDDVLKHRTKTNTLSTIPETPQFLSISPTHQRKESSDSYLEQPSDISYTHQIHDPDLYFSHPNSTTNISLGFSHFFNEKVELQKLKNKQIGKERHSPALKNKNKLRVEKALLFGSNKYYLCDSEEVQILHSKQKFKQNKNTYLFYQGSVTQNKREESYIGCMKQQKVDSSVSHFNVYSKQGSIMALIKFQKHQHNKTNSIIMIPKMQSSIPIQLRHSLDNQMIEVRSVSPYLDQNTNKLRLNLHGLGKISSSKNCVLQFGNKDVMIIGKQARNEYNVHYNSPLTDLIAFAYSISNYNLKI